MDIIRSDNKGGNFAPLYVYSDDGLKVPNFNKEIWQKINEAAGETKPEDILDYIYAYSSFTKKYRAMYNEFLKQIFRVLLYPKSKRILESRTTWRKARELHMLEATELQSFNLGITFTEGSREVVKKTVWSDGNRVYINDVQYF